MWELLREGDTTDRRATAARGRPTVRYRVDAASLLGICDENYAKSSDKQLKTASKATAYA